MNTMNLLAKAVDFKDKTQEGIALLGVLLSDNKNLNEAIESYEVSYVTPYTYYQNYHIFEEVDLMAKMSLGSQFVTEEDRETLEKYIHTFKPDLFKSYKKEYYMKEKEEDVEVSFVKEEFSQPILATLANSDTWFISLTQYQLQKDREGFTQYIYDENLIGQLIEFNHFKALDYLLQEGFVFNHVNKQGFYPIFSIKSIEAFEYLKEKDIDWDVVGAKKKTIISFVSQVKDANVSKVLFNRIVKLLKNGAEEQIVSGIIENFRQKKTQSEILNSIKKYKKPLQEIRDEDDNNLFLMALKYNNVRIATKLLQEKLDFEHVNSNGEKAFNYALNLSSYHGNDRQLRETIFKQIFQFTDPFSANFAQDMYLKNIKGDSSSLPLEQIHAKFQELGIQAQLPKKQDRYSYNANWEKIIPYLENYKAIEANVVDKLIEIFNNQEESNSRYGRKAELSFLENGFSPILFQRFYDKEKMEQILEKIVAYVSQEELANYGYIDRFLSFMETVGFDKLSGRLASLIKIDSLNRSSESKKEFYISQLEKRRLEDMVVVQDKVVKRRKI